MKSVVHFFIVFWLFTISLPTSAQKRLSLSTFPQDKVMTIAHRGDWRNAPENSIWAIEGAINKGVNMAEVDLAMTKDSVLILMHDKTIDRTTTGTGKPEDYTLEEIRKFYLRDGLGVKTEQKIPTLEEVLDVANNRIFLNLDKGFSYISRVLPLLEKRKMLDQVLFKGTETYKDFNRKYSTIKDKIHFMPIVRLQLNEGLGKIEGYEANYKGYGYEFTVGSDEAKMIDFLPLRQKGRRIWVNALWPEHNAGHSDDRALKNPAIYNWFMEKNVNCIQTDHPQLLIEFLKSKGLYQPNMQ